MSNLTVNKTLSDKIFSTFGLPSNITFIIDEIKNPILKRQILDLTVHCGCWIFSDNSKDRKYNHTDHDDYKDHKEYSDYNDKNHTDHSEKYDDYNDYSVDYGDTFKNEGAWRKWKEVPKS